MAEGGVNQNMDDILAQIRKIIAEDGTSSSAPFLTGRSPPPIAVAAPPAPPQSLAGSVAATAVAPALPPDDFSDLVEIESIAVAPPASAATSAPQTTVTPIELTPMAMQVQELIAQVDSGDTMLDKAPVADVIQSPEIQSLEAPTVESIVAATAAPVPDHAVDAPVAAEVAIEPAALQASDVEPNVPPIIAAVVDQAPASSTVVADAAHSTATTLTVPEPTVDVMARPTIAAVAPVSLAAMFANRVDPAPAVRAGIIVPTHIGLTVATPPSSVPGPTPIAVAPAVNAIPGGSALGALAAGLAASGLARPAPASPAPAPAMTPISPPPPAPASSVDAPAAEAAVVAATTATPPSADDVMDALRPILADWIADTLPRALEGALREALPDLIGKARASAERRQAS